MSSQSIKNLNDSSPAAQTGYQLAKWQQGSTTGNDPITGFPIFPVSVETPGSGSTSRKTGAYTLATTDCGKLVALDSTSNFTFTLPATPPSVVDGGGVNRWVVGVSTINTGQLTLQATSGAKLDGVVGGSVTFLQNTGCIVYTDGTDYFTQRGSATSIGGVAAKTASYTAVSADTGKLINFNSGSPVTLTLPATAPSTTWFIEVQNIGAGALTISPNGRNLDGSASSITLAQNQGVYIGADGTNYFTQRGMTDTSSLATKAGVQQENYTAADDTGVANAYVIAVTPAPTIVKYSEFTFIAAHANTGASTLAVTGAVSGGSATAIKKNGNIDLQLGDIVAGQIVTVKSDGTFYQMSSPVPQASTSVTNFVQSRSVEISFGFGIGPSTLAFSSNITAGNAILVSWVFTGGTSISGVCTDSLGNTYTQVFNQNFNGAQTCVFLALNSPGGANTVTVTATVTGTVLHSAALSIQEYSGLPTSAAVDTSNFANNGGTGTVTVPITTSAPGMLYLFSCFTSAPSTTTPAVTGFTLREAQYGGAPQLFTMDSVSTSAGTYSVVFPTLGGGVPNQVFVLALKAQVTGLTGTVTSVSATVPSDFAVTVATPATTPTIAITGGVTKSGVQQEAYTYAADTGAANAYAVTLSPAPTLVAGSEVCFKAVNANTGASTLAVNGGTATAIKKNGNSTALASGDIAAGQIVTAKYDGTVWQILVGSSASAGVSSMNSLTGALSITAGTGITVTPSGSNIAIAATGGGGGGSGSLILLEEHAASASAALLFTARNVTGQSGATFQSDFDVYVLIIENLVPTTNGTQIFAQVSSDGGATYDGAAHYAYTDWRFASTSGSAVLGSSTSILWWVIASPEASLSNSATNGGLNSEAKIFNPLSTSGSKHINGTGTYFDTSGALIAHHFGSAYKQTTAINAFKILAGTGNLTSGTVRLYGIAQ